MYEYIIRNIALKIAGITAVQNGAIINPRSAIRALALYIFAPNLCVFSHTLFELSVHGVLIPMNQFLLAFSSKIPV